MKAYELLLNGFPAACSTEQGERLILYMHEHGLLTFKIPRS